MVKLKLIAFVLIETVSCAFFDLTDVDDPLSLFWQQNKDFSIIPTSSPCIVPVPGTGSVIPGQCKHKTLCALSGGQTNNNGNCGNFLTCCTKATDCSHRTKSKVSYFSSDVSNFATDCEHTVEIQNDNICQVRLDFEQFHLTPVQDVATAPRTCAGEYLTVTPGVPNVPQFCGYNNGQHAYVHLNGQNEVKLRINFAGTAATTIVTPTWRIRVTQLECLGHRNWLNKHNVFGYSTDLPLIAPEGAAQYFTETSGRVKSFGFSDGQDNYASGLYYAIAFKRQPSANCIRFTVNNIGLSNTATAGVVTCQDYLFIPEVRDINGPVEESKVCLASAGNVYRSSVPGPFYMYFRSSVMDGAVPPPRGFDVQYEVTSCPPDLT